GHERKSKTSLGRGSQETPLTEVLPSSQAILRRRCFSLRVSEAGFAIGSSPAIPVASRGRLARRALTAAVRWAAAAGNAAAIVWLWVHGGNVPDHLTTGELLTSLARLTGLLGSYLALLQVLLLARLPCIERLV